DRIGHKRVAMTSMLVACANAFLMAFLIHMDLMSIWVLFATATVQGVVVSFDFPARQSMVSDMVERPELAAAIAFNMSTFHVGSFIGPILGGFIVKDAGMAVAFLVYGLTIIWFFFALMFVNVRFEPKSQPDEDSQLPSLLNDIVVGLQYLLHHRSLRWVVLLNFCGAFLLRPYMELLPGYADVIFNRSVDGLSLLVAASGLGAFVGSFLLAMRGQTKGLTNILLYGLGFSCISLMAFASSSNFLIGQICLFFGALTLVGASVCSHSLIQHSVEPALRGRVISLTMSLSVGGMATGSLGQGLLAEIVGLQWPVIAAALILILILLLLAKTIRSNAEKLEGAIS
ncbi:MAG: MFS transporter, partial [Rhodospirillaceae bacterium]|nr:MFS transporter [Rhodospirillaceae bacterium]